MKTHHPSMGVERLCSLFGKTRQAYYDHYWRHSDDQLQEALIVELVRSVRQRLPKIGARKLLLMLQEDFAAHHISIGRDSFVQLLRNHGLLVKRTKRYVRTTDSNHPFKKWPDLIKELAVTATEQLWVSDITYLRTESGFIYLSLITDAYSHKIVGYHLSQHLKAQGCIIALNKAIATLKGTEQQRKLIHHSDRGVQYCCDAYVQVLQHHHIAISMTQSGSPYDNAMAERVNGILKTELDLERTFQSYSAAVPVVHQAIDAYNRLRPHMSCGNLTPDQVHQHQQPTTAVKKMWKSKPRTVKLNPYYCE
jgi:transposase InsO family protein